MKIITVEEHFNDRRIMDANNAYNEKQTNVSPERAEAMKFLASRAFPGDALLDFDKMSFFFNFVDEGFAAFVAAHAFVRAGYFVHMRGLIDTFDELETVLLS